MRLLIGANVNINVGISMQVMDVIKNKLICYENEKSNHLGYPYNLSFDCSSISPIQNFLINNLGDPYIGSHYGTNACDLERQVLTFLMEVWGCSDKQDFWGYVGASGTEGNLWGLYLAREALPDAVLFYSKDAHYSIPKSANILRMKTVRVPTDKNGALSLTHFHHALTDSQSRQVIITVTCGTTMKGAYDDIQGVIAVLRQAGYERDQWYIHCDGALNGMVVPFLQDVPMAIIPSFISPIDSISTSGHKMIGTPMPCGVLVARRCHVEKVSSSVTYLKSHDTTLMGSRNGHAVFALWSRFMQHGKAGFTADARECHGRALRLANALKQASVPLLLNDYSITVVFPEPASDIVKTFQLACDQGLAHAVVMPNVTDKLIDHFISVYLKWWENQHAQAQEENCAHANFA